MSGHGRPEYPCHPLDNLLRQSHFNVDLLQSLTATLVAPPCWVTRGLHRSLTAPFENDSSVALDFVSRAWLRTPLISSFLHSVEGEVLWLRVHFIDKASQL